MSWITLSDLCAVILHCVQAGTLHGPVNAVSPSPVTNLEFTKTLGRTLSRPTIFPLPGFAARIALGEMADALLLASARVEPAKLLATRFGFEHKDLQHALKVVLSR
jgi:NAD dependent epimerase/dehydratase family enzyme